MFYFIFFLHLFLVVFAAENIEKPLV